MAAIARVAATLRSLAGRRRWAVAALLGAAATAALPPLFVVPLAIAAFVGLVWLIEGAQRPRAAAAVGWWFGYGHFVTGHYWIANALLVDADRFGWMVPFAVLGLNAGFAIYTAGAALALHLSRARGWRAAFVLALCWFAAEWLRGHLLTGFPWNLIGTIWAVSSEMMQAAALFGLYGLGLVTVLAAALLAPLGDPSRPAAERRAAAVAAMLILAALWAGGAWRLSGAVSASVPDARLRIVQPDIAQSLKWERGRLEENFRLTLALAREPGFEGRNLVVWPETAVPFVLSNDPERRVQAAAAVPPGGLLVTGGIRTAPDPVDGFRAWNSLYALDAGGGVVATYDKFHLVPFGEYVPLRGILAIAKVTHGTRDFSTGPGVRSLALRGLPKTSPLICYEVIFPAAVADPADRPGWIVNLTNDAWFGISSGPHQHFASARFRAVEEGLPVVRAANNGISAVVDGYGRITASLALGKRGIVDADLPVALAMTPYARFGDWTVFFLALVCAAVALVTISRAKALANPSAN